MKQVTTIDTLDGQTLASWQIYQGARSKMLFRPGSLIVLIFVSFTLWRCDCSAPLPPSLAEDTTRNDGGVHSESVLIIEADINNTEPGAFEKWTESYSLESSPDRSCEEGVRRTCEMNPKGCSKGSQTCRNGQWQVCAGGKPAKPEVCNDFDDDCDGLVDNLPCYTGPANTISVGLCQKGIYLCRRNSKIDVCLNERKPTGEVCDSQDNDCNGLVDDNDVCTKPLETGKTINIQQGTFLMGASKEVDPFSQEVEQPVIRVTLSTFSIDRYEVTNKEYSRCVRAKVCTSPQLNGPEIRAFPLFPKDYLTNPQYNEFPVVGVTWKDAVDYCNFVGKTLPTEAQWERAAKGSQQSNGPEWYRYPWGSKLPDDCKYANVIEYLIVKSSQGSSYRSYSTCGHFPARIGSYKLDRSRDGALDMAGNVMEWTRDCFSRWYGIAKSYDNPVDLTCETGGIYDPSRVRTVRGGSFATKAELSRTSSRLGRKGGKHSIWIGFRCAMQRK